MGKDSLAGERRRAGAFRVNVKKHSAAALGEYLDRHPQWETTEVRIKIEQQSALTREKLEELVRRLIEKNGFSAHHSRRVSTLSAGGYGSGALHDA